MNDKDHIESKVIPIEYVKMRASLNKLSKAFKDQDRKNKNLKKVK